MPVSTQTQRKRIRARENAERKLDILIAECREANNSGDTQRASILVWEIYALAISLGIDCPLPGAEGQLLASAEDAIRARGLGVQLD